MYLLNKTRWTPTSISYISMCIGITWGFWRNANCFIRAGVRLKILYFSQAPRSCYWRWLMATLRVVRDLQASAQCGREGLRCDPSNLFTLPQIPNSCQWLKVNSWKQTLGVAMRKSLLRPFNTATHFSSTQLLLITRGIQPTGFTLNDRAVRGGESDPTNRAF